MTPTQIYRHNVIRETEKAILVGFDDGRHVVQRFNQSGQHRNSDYAVEVWLPKSQIAWVETIYGEQLQIAKWLASKVAA